MYRLMLLAVAILAGAFGLADTKRTRADKPAELIVHEWGTFSTFSAADGTCLPFQPKNEDLPPFVYKQIGASAGQVLVSMETPVIYFYAPRELTASVRVDFPEGRFSDYYPKADVKQTEGKESRWGATLSWREIRLRPDARAAMLPQSKGDNHYFAARATDAVPVEVAVREGKKETLQQEKFLFYHDDFRVRILLSFRLECVGREFTSGIIRGKMPEKGKIMAIVLKSMTWLERVEANRFDDWTKERMIHEMPHTYFIGYLPLELSFLQGRFVDLGFENLGLSSQEHREVMLAFGGTGVHIPGTQLRMRFAYPHAEVEPTDGSETATLPSWWKECVLVTDDQAIPTWVGKRLRPDQTAGFHLQGYKDAGEGLTPP